MQVDGYPADQMDRDTQGHFGGQLTLPDGEVKIAFIPAIHGSGVAAPEGSADKEVHYGGTPGGFLITIKHGPTIYHTGDHFTMGPERAAEAVKLVNPGEVIPAPFRCSPAPPRPSPRPSRNRG